MGKGSNMQPARSALTMLTSGIFLFLSVIPIQGCFKDCQCDNITATVQCSKFVSTWYNLLSDLPKNITSLYLENGVISEKPEQFPFYKTDQQNELNTPSKEIYFPIIQILHIRSVDFQEPLTPSSFHPFINTAELHLPSNSLTSFGSGWAVLRHLKVLNVSHNLIEEVKKEWFKDLSNLRVLDLSHNKIHILPHDVFDILEGLESLHIDNNRLGYVHPNSIGNLTELHTLHLDSNSLVTLHETMLPEDGISFRRVQLQGNPWDCNCGLLWLHKLLRSNASEKLFQDADGITCETPSQYKGVPIRNLTSEMLHCQKPVFVEHPKANESLQRILGHTLPCNASGIPAPAIYWLTPEGVLAQARHRKYISPDILRFAQKHNFQGVPLNIDSSIEVLDDGSLHFNHVRWYYAGNYACVAENPAGISMYKIRVRVTTVLKTVVWTSMIYGGLVAAAFLLLSLIYATIHLIVMKTCCRKEKTFSEKTHSTLSSIEEIEDFIPPPDPSLCSPYYLSPDWSREFPSPLYSPTKCVTPSEDYDPTNQRAHIKETLEDVRGRLHQKVERQKEKIRTRAAKVRESSSQYMHTIRETGTLKIHNLKDTSSQAVKNIKTSGTQAVQSLRSSTGQYANRVRAGVVLGVEQVKYHVQSMKEFCGTGDIGQTISTVSIQTNVDYGDSSEVIKQITYV